MHPEPFIEIHPRDAACLGIPDHCWVEVRSRRAKGRFPAKVTEAIAPERAKAFSFSLSV
jgi:ferredoxin-nitrate reductase